VKLISVEHKYWNSLSIMEQKKSLLASKLETSDDIEKVKFNESKQIIPILNFKPPI
jgi:hypothetical protein